MPCTTRPPRPGESEGAPYYFVSKEQFERGIQAGEFVFNAPIRTHRSGTKRSELLRSPYALIDILPIGARQLREVISREKLGMMFSIFVNVPSEIRRERIIRREPGLISNPAKVEIMMTQDPVESNCSLYSDFDLITDNLDGEIDQTVERISDKMVRFMWSQAIIKNMC